MKLLVYTDGKPAALDALRFAAELQKRLDAELAVITARAGTHAAEEPPPVGSPVPWSDCDQLPQGLGFLTAAAAALAQQAVVEQPQSITIQDTPKGYMFVCQGPGGRRIPFYECFGPFIETLNQEVDEHGHDLLIAAPPRRHRLGRLVTGDATRKLALDLHTSVLVVRGGGPDSRYLICADGSPSSRRQFPMLRQLLPAIGPPVELLCVQKPEADPPTIQAAQECLEHARDWLARCGRQGSFKIQEGEHRAEMILSAAGDDRVIMMGASLRHDVYRRMLGSLPLRILERTAASVLLVKLPPEADADFMKDPFTCG